MRAVLSIIWLGVLILFGISCRKDFEYSSSTGDLQFSRDTVFLDTIFSNIGSSTYTLKVYNRSNNDISIPIIGLGQGQDSGYRLNIDGSAGKVFTDIALMAKDSLFIFIETTYDSSADEVSEFLYTDVIQFDQGDRLQQVQLVTLVKDAIFLFDHNAKENRPESISMDIGGYKITAEAFELTDDQLHFKNQKPYVIYGYATVPETKTLLIDPGVNVYFHKNSGIFVNSDASLYINGQLSENKELLENEVLFEGDRLEPEYKNVAGQWGGVLIASGSRGNTIDHLTIKNATIGILVAGDSILDKSTLTIKNTQIYNSSKINLKGLASAIVGENLVLGNAGESSLQCSSGGNYSFSHCTIANYWTNSFRENAALHIDNIVVDIEGTKTQTDLANAEFINCIIAGNRAQELSLIEDENRKFNFSFTNCILTFLNQDDSYQDTPLYDFQDQEKYNEIIRMDKNVGFKNEANSDFRLSEISPARNEGQLERAIRVPLDILGTDRTKTPDLGAYEFEIQN